MGILSRLRGKAPAGGKTEKILVSPLAGEVIPLESVNDPVFAEKSLGDGTAIRPSEGKLYAPADGTVTTIFPTSHALAMESREGLTIILHVGIDTVNMKGEGFTVHIRSGEQVKAGQLLVSFDLEKIRQAGYEATTMVLLADYQGSETLKKRAPGPVTPREKLLWLL